MITNEQISDAIDKETIKAYETYLLESEDSKTSDMREDTFIHGFRDGAIWVLEFLKKEMKKGK